MNGGNGTGAGAGNGEGQSNGHGDGDGDGNDGNDGDGNGDGRDGQCDGDGDRRSYVFRCFACGLRGHTKSKCPNPTGGVDAADVKCFGCRGIGHSLRNCPVMANGDKKSNVTRNRCFNCGEIGHASRNCVSEWVNDGCSFATCFVCFNMGHLSRNCPEKREGKSIYPDGGACHKCQSTQHLAKNCDVFVPDDERVGDCNRESDDGKTLELMNVSMGDGDGVFVLLQRTRRHIRLSISFE